MVFFAVRTPVIIIDMLITLGTVRIRHVVTAVYTIPLLFAHPKAHIAVRHTHLTAHIRKDLAVEAHIMLRTEEVLIVEIAYIALIADPHTVTAIGNAMARFAVVACRSHMPTVFFTDRANQRVVLMAGLAYIIGAIEVRHLSARCTSDAMFFFPTIDARKALHAIFGLRKLVKGNLAKDANIEVRPIVSLRAIVANGSGTVTLRYRETKARATIGVTAIVADQVLIVEAVKTAETVRFRFIALHAMLGAETQIILRIGPQTAVLTSVERAIVIGFPFGFAKIAKLHHIGRNRHGTDDRYEHDHKCDREQFKNSFFHRIFSFFQIFAGTARRKYFGISPILK